MPRGGWAWCPVSANIPEGPGSHARGSELADDRSLANSHTDCGSHETRLSRRAGWATRTRRYYKAVVVVFVKWCFCREVSSVHLRWSSCTQADDSDAPTLCSFAGCAALVLVPFLACFSFRSTPTISRRPYLGAVPHVVFTQIPRTL